ASLEGLAPSAAASANGRFGSTNFPPPLLSVQPQTSSAPAPASAPTSANAPATFLLPDLVADFPTKRTSAIAISPWPTRGRPAEYVTATGAGKFAARGRTVRNPSASHESPVRPPSVSWDGSS